MCPNCVPICYPTLWNTVCACKLSLIGVSHLPDQLSRGGGGVGGWGCPCAQPPRGLWRLPWLGRLCRIIGLTLALIVLVCEPARHLQQYCSLLQFCLSFSCGVFEALQEMTAKCLDRESPFSPDRPSPFPKKYICTWSRL